jgi:hypothetical protein
MIKHSKEKFKKRSNTIKINIPKTCKICSKELKSLPGLASHLKNQHSLSYGEYLKQYYNIDVEKLNEEWENGKEERKQKQLSGLRNYNETFGKRSPKDRMTSDNYNKWRKSMKKVFTLDWYKEKYGDDGERRYNERNQTVSDKCYWKKYNREVNRNNYSKVSQELFWEIYKQIKNRYKNIYFMELNHEYSCSTHFNFDFVVVDNKKVIEFNGDKWHANPQIYEENDVPLDFIDKTAKELWEHDREKHEKAIQNGYQIKVVWEKNYCENKEQTVLECIHYIV